MTWFWVQTVAWPWLKKNWLYVLFFPVVLLAVIVSFLEGKNRGKVVVVDKREESDAADEFAKKVEERKSAAIDELEQRRAEQVELVVKEHVDTINQMTEEQRAKVDELLDDPEALHSYLLDVGRRARGTSD